MTVVLIATQLEEVQNLLPWAAHFAASAGQKLKLVLTQRRKGESRLIELSAVAEADESELVTQSRSCIDRVMEDHASAKLASIELALLAGETQGSNLSELLPSTAPTLVIAPAPNISKDQSADDDWQTSLMKAVDCDVMLLRDDAIAIDDEVRVAVFVTDGTDNEAALVYATKLVKHVGGTATAVYVEPNVGDDAASVGRRQLQNMLDRTVRRRDRDLFKQQVVVAGSFDEAFRELNASEFDILIIGTRNLGEMRRFLSASPAGTTEDSTAIPAVSVVKQGDTLGNRLLSRAGRILTNNIPQLSREERVGLVSRIQDSSKWDFDFIFLISLATLIACFGLAEDSGAVIVGAMLVAPLMTPIAGVGLGVAHANAYLTKVALRTALRGFATAVCIGILFGLCVQGCAGIGWLSPLQNSVNSDLPGIDDDTVSTAFTFPVEMEKRTRPQFYDLLIALTSGLAAAYAMGRPNLFSALPGVAIAAALVPPLATSGIAFSHGDLTKGGGALLLFLTNMVTIILATSLVFRAVGIRSQKAGPTTAQWPRYVLLLLVVLSSLLTVIIELNNRPV